MSVAELDRSWDRAGPAGHRITLPDAVSSDHCSPCPAQDAIVRTVEAVNHPEPLIRRALELPDISVTSSRNGCCYGG